MNELMVRNERQNAVLNIQSKNLTIGEKKIDVTPQQLCRMIMNVTQQIGEYRRMDNPYAAYVITSLRKVRHDMTSDLEHHFKIGHKIGSDGRSRFYSI